MIKASSAAGRARFALGCEIDEKGLGSISWWKATTAT
jgi:hypothetical protein